MRAGLLMIVRMIMRISAMRMIEVGMRMITITDVWVCFCVCRQQLVCTAW